MIEYFTIQDSAQPSLTIFGAASKNEKLSYNGEEWLTGIMISRHQTRNGGILTESYHLAEESNQRIWLEKRGMKPITRQLFLHQYTTAIAHFNAIAGIAAIEISLKQ